MSRAEEGPVVAVIGGGSGIGAETSQLLTENGWRVVVCDLDLSRAEQIAAPLGAAARKVDVRDPQSVRALAEDVEATVGPVEGLVMAAALFQRISPPEDTPIEEWDTIVDVCLKGTYIANVEFGNRMARRGRGSIVNLSSFNSQRPAPMHAYCSAKAGVEALTGGMAGEWGRSNVRVNTVTPGTTLVQRVRDRIASGTRYAVPLDTLTALGRLCEPREIAEAIHFLLSSRASGITGANIVVDAGMMVAPSWVQFGGVPPSRVVAPASGS